MESETQDELLLGLRKWAEPRGIFRHRVNYETRLSSDFLFNALPSSANFLQRAVHVMSAMLSEDKKFRLRVPGTLNFAFAETLRSERARKTSAWLLLSSLENFAVDRVGEQKKLPHHVVGTKVAVKCKNFS